MVATDTQLILRSSIVGPAKKSLYMPDLLEHLKYHLLLENDTEKIPKENNCPASLPEEGWRTVKYETQIWFYSKWHANYAKFLEVLRIDKTISDWEYQPKSFWLTDRLKNYTPTFRVGLNDNTNNWIDIDSHGNALLVLKVIAFLKLYPDEVIREVDTSWFKENVDMLKLHIPDWE